MTNAPATAKVEYSGEDMTFEGYVARPPGLERPLPCVLLAHDWSGLGRGMQTVAERIARLGYACFALDLYGKGVRGDERADNSHLMAPLLDDRGLLRHRLLLGLAAARRHEAVDAGRLAVMGYCFGGLCSLDLARAAPPDLRAAISVHGALAPPNLGPQRRMTASILVLHGWDDPIAPPDAVSGLARELTDADADWQLHAYGQAMHAFTFEGAAWPERGIAYEPRAARRAWVTTCRFLAEVFEGTP